MTEMHDDATAQKREITLKDVETGIAYFQKQLHRDSELTAAQAVDYFTKIHVHAAWTGLDALANLAERIWSDLDELDGDHPLDTEERASVARLLVTYKFLLHRVGESLGSQETDAELSEAS